MRRLADSNRCKRFCRPLPSHSAKTPKRKANLRKKTGRTREKIFYPKNKLNRIALSTKQNIHFILNPISGSGQNQLRLETIMSVFNNKNYNVTLKTSSHATSLSSLAQLSIKEGADVVVACGGDGTINEIASPLVDTKIPLGIITLGSGNGLASHLEIPKKLLPALELIRDCHKIKIDVGVVNEHFFFSNMSVGVGAQVINHYSKSKNRQLMSYLLATLKALWPKTTLLKLKIEMEGLKKEISPLVLFVSNSNEMGYKVSFTPKASLQDGKLDVVLTDQLSFFQKLIFAYQIVFMKNKKFKKAKYFLTHQMRVTNKKGERFLIQIDGESKIITSKVLDVSLRKAALNVIVPRI